MENPFNKLITQVIENSQIVVTTDVSIKNNSMIGYRIIILMQIYVHIENTIYHKEYRSSTMISIKKIALFKLKEVIVKKIKHINCGSIKIGFDNKIVYQNVNKKLVKSIQYSQDRGAMITRIKELIKQATINIELIFTEQSK